MNNTDTQSIAATAFFTTSAALKWRIDKIGISAALHGVTLTAVLYGATFTPMLVRAHPEAQGQLRTIDFRRKVSASSAPHKVRPAASSAGARLAVADSDAVYEASMQAIAHITASQTLIQPEIVQVDTLLKEIPLPNLTLRSPRMVIQTITPTRQSDPILTNAPVKSADPGLTLLAHTDHSVPETLIEVPRVNQSEPLPVQKASAQLEAADAGTPKAFNEGEGTGNLTRGVDSTSGIAEHVAHLVRSKDGEFGMVILGASLEEQYPEAAGAWNGRVAYTVPLTTGSETNWIFQYSLPQPDRNGTNLKAPWPFDIYCPDLSAVGLSEDSVTLHGFVNREGRFEHLTVLSSLSPQQTKFLTDTLQRWQFRAATHNEQPVTVEVLLVIPAQTR